MNTMKNRTALAAEISRRPKNERRTTLEAAKDTEEYWQSRSETIQERQDEQETDNGLGILIDKKTLYHGSARNDIKHFDKAEEETVGSGVYFTSEANKAVGYARERAKVNRDASPIIYEAAVENMKLLDLRKEKNILTILKGFRPIVLNAVRKPDLQWHERAGFERALTAIDSGEVGTHNLRNVTFSTGPVFSEYCKSLGYDGLITFEGGDGDIGLHDTYLIFDPEKATIIQEHKIV